MTSIRPPQKPTLVVFDLDDTLYNYVPCNQKANEALLLLASNETGVPIGQISEQLSLARDAVKTRTAGTAASHSRLLYIHEMLTRIGFGARPQLALNLESEFWRVYISSMELAQGAQDLLDALRYHKITVGLVTDLTMQIQLRKLVYLGLETTFDFLIASEEAGGEKPDLVSFGLLSERTTEEERESVWFVGDKEYDAPVEALIDAGIIKAGFGWVRGAHAQRKKSLDGWNSLAEVEAALVRSISAD